MKVLVTGAGGLVGREVVRAPSTATTSSRATTPGSTSATATGARGRARDPGRRSCHPAAWTSVDACEDDPDRAFAVNGLGVRYVAEAARRAGAYLVYVSTDYVFDGEHDRPYLEWDAHQPGLGLRAVEAGRRVRADLDATVVRTSWVCGDTASNIVSIVLRLAREQETLRFVDDQRGRPTVAADLAPRAAPARRRAPARRPPRHEPGHGDAVRVRAAILEAAGDDPARVEPVDVAELDPPRPRDPPGQLGARQRRPARRGRTPAPRLPRVAPRPRPLDASPDPQERTARAMTSVPNAVRIAR